jgi:hypothetical protein
MGLAGLLHSTAHRPNKSKSRRALVAGCASAKLTRSSDCTKQKKDFRMMPTLRFALRQPMFLIMTASIQAGYQSTH